MRHYLENFFNQMWYKQSYRYLSIGLTPIECLYKIISTHFIYKKQLHTTHSLPVPIVVIGNLVVGGSGKTPVTQALALALQAKGIRVGIISRGYGGTVIQATIVNSNYPNIFGDEPCLLADTTQSTVVVAKNRYKAAELLCQTPSNSLNCPVDIILSDDGLQHAGLHRDFEICVIGIRGLGNQHCLPNGPLREPIQRLHTVNAVISWQTQFKYSLPNHVPYWVIKGKHTTLQCLNGNDAPEKNLNELAKIQTQLRFPITVIAGIANPAPFYTMLKAAGIQFNTVSISDHGVLHKKQLQSIPSESVLLITEKDAIKLRINPYLSEQLITRIRVVPWRVELPDVLINQIIDLIAQFKHSKF